MKLGTNFWSDLYSRRLSKWHDKKAWICFACYLKQSSLWYFQGWGVIHLRWLSVQEVTGSISYELPVWKNTKTLLVMKVLFCKRNRGMPRLTFLQVICKINHHFQNQGRENPLHALRTNPPPTLSLSTTLSFSTAAPPIIRAPLKNFKDNEHLVVDKGNYGN